VNPTAAAAVTVALLAANAFFVAAEFALVAARRSAIELQAEHGSRRAGATLRAMRRLSLMLAGAQLGVTVCSLALGAVSEPALAHLLEPAFDAFGLPTGATQPAAFVIALALITGLHVVLGEMVPKNATLAAPDTAALWLAPPLAATVHVLRPLIAALNGATNLALRAIRIQPRDDVATAVTGDQLAGAVRQSHRAGLLDEDEHELLANAISFETATAADLTLPLDRVHTLTPEATAEAVERLATTTGVSRFPVRAGGRLLGYLHLRDVLDTPPDERGTPIPAAIRRPLPAITSDLPLSETVEQMRTRKAHIAAVTAIDDEDRVIGIVTLDDILASLTR
jgi:CBS domain containing-hemolysin-like protein